MAPATVWGLRGNEPSPAGPSSRRRRPGRQQRPGDNMGGDAAPRDSVERRGTGRGGQDFGDGFAEALAGGAFVRLEKTCIGMVATRADQGDVMAPVNQTVDKPVADPLDATVALGWNLVPGGRLDGDMELAGTLHGASFCIDRPRHGR